MWCVGYMLVQRPGRGITFYGSCSVVGLRWWAGVYCVCLWCFPSLVPACSCIPNHRVSLYHTLATYVLNDELSTHTYYFGLHRSVARSQLVHQQVCPSSTASTSKRFTANTNQVGADQSLVQPKRCVHAQLERSVGLDHKPWYCKLPVVNRG